MIYMGGERAANANSQQGNAMTTTTTNAVKIDRREARLLHDAMSEVGDDHAIAKHFATAAEAVLEGATDEVEMRDVQAFRKAMQDASDRYDDQGRSLKADMTDATANWMYLNYC